MATPTGKKPIKGQTGVGSILGNLVIKATILFKGLHDVPRVGAGSSFRQPMESMAIPAETVMNRARISSFRIFRGNRPESVNLGRKHGATWRPHPWLSLFPTRKDRGL